MTVDLVLSSGFLAFARHAGFLLAVEELGLAVDGVCGTSSGSMTGALWAAGYSASRVADELSAGRPLRHVRPGLTPWRGLLSGRAMVRHLSRLLPARIEDLERPFAVGVAGQDGRHELLTSGPLPEAIAASCAIPRLFQPVVVEGTPWQDGAFADRIGIAAWRRVLAAQVPGELDAVVHIVERSSGVESEEGLGSARIVRTPRSGASLWSLGDFRGQMAEARALTLAALGG
jgi:predicted acylesterase/phospholipase RssA